MAMLRIFSHWLTTTNLSWAVRGGVPWIWPAAETIHFIGLCLLVGAVGLLDMRLVGWRWTKGLPVGPLERLVPWGILGFSLCLVTGVMFYSGDPFQYIDNTIFWIKMAFIAAAGLNVLYFYASGLSRVVDGTPAGEDVPRAAKVVGALSLVLWVGVIYWGRMLPFLGGAF
jgi:hypothetical protein